GDFSSAGCSVVCSTGCVGFCSVACGVFCWLDGVSSHQAKGTAAQVNSVNSATARINRFICHFLSSMALLYHLSSEFFDYAQRDVSISIKDWPTSVIVRLLAPA